LTQIEKNFCTLIHIKVYHLNLAINEVCLLGQRIPSVEFLEYLLSSAIYAGDYYIAQFSPELIDCDEVINGSDERYVLIREAFGDGIR